MKSFALATLVVVLAWMSAAPAAQARVQPVYNVVDKSIFTKPGKALDLGEVERIVRLGAIAKGWSVNKVSDGHLVADIHVRKHYAAVDITFDADSYSIAYKDSRVLKYDGSRIHRNYNKWIVLMERQIDEGFLAQ